MGNYIGLRVTINGEHSDKEWVRLRLQMVNSKHVVGFATQRHYVGANSRGSDRSFYNNKSRISVLWGEFPSQGLHRTFHGYITHHKASDIKTDANGRYIEVTYYLIGTSDPLQKKHSWTGSSWSSAAKKIAKRHKMKAVVHQTPKLTKPLVQHKTDFKFLVDGAAATGYRFFVWADTLYFVNPAKMLNTRTSNTPLFENGDIHNLDVEASEDEGMAYEVSGVAADGSTVTARTQTPGSDYDPEEDDSGPQSVEYLDSVVADQAEAKAAIEARVLQDQNWVRASLETRGDARVIPGLVIYLNDTEMADEHKGLWIVNDVTHFVDISDTQAERAYHMELNVSRDRVRALTIPGGDTVFLDLEDPEESVPWEASDEWDDTPEDPVEVGGVWQAEYYGDDDSQVEY